MVVQSRAMLLSPSPCHCLPGAGQLPLPRGGPQSHPASDQKEMAGLARRPGHSVPLDFFRCGWGPQGEGDPLPYPLPRGQLGGRLLETSSN